jgi:TatA/E family protein of Tat protein translocase
MIGDILQPTHLLFILIVALVVLGPKRLPEVARTLGNGLRDFRSAINGEGGHDEDDRYEIPEAHTREDLAHEDVGRVYEPEPTPEPDPAHAPAPPAQAPAPPVQAPASPAQATAPAAPTPAPQAPAPQAPASQATAPGAHPPEPAHHPEPAATGEPQAAAAPGPPPGPTPTSQHEANGVESVPDRPQHADKPA